MSDTTETVYTRSPDVVWRLGPDRVLARRIGASGEHAAAELSGPAALVWIALDDPASTEAVLVRLEESGIEIGVDDIGVLVDAGWIVSRSEDSRPKAG